MEDRFERASPNWGPIADPVPWGPAVDPMPWEWWYRPHRRWPPIWGPIDPPPLREKLIERIEIADLVALQQAQLEAVQAQLQAQVDLIGKQIEILGKYGQG